MKNIYYSISIGAVAERHPLTYFDIGSRDGFQSDLHPIAFAVDAVGFEPDPVEFERLQKLQSQPWKSVKILPHGVSGTTGRQTLYIPTDPQSASLLKHDAAIGKKFDKPQFFEIKRTEDIQTLDLKDTLKISDVDSVDVLKIDIEGAELAVFKSSPEVMSDVLGVKTEISYIPFRNAQPLANDVDAFLTESGFELMDIIQPAHWRRHGYLIHPYYSTETPPYSKGQIVQADYLYFRDPDTLGDDISQLMKLCLVSMAFGYFDHALMILERPELATYLDREFNVSPIAIVAPASRLYGRKVFLHAFYRQVRDLIPFARYLKNLLR